MLLPSLKSFLQVPICIFFLELLCMTNKLNFILRILYRHVTFVTDVTMQQRHQQHAAAAAAAAVAAIKATHIKHNKCQLLSLYTAAHL